MDRLRYERALAAIDAANAGDPNTLVWAGEERPKELLHAELMTGWVQRLDVDACEAQLLAARAHHLRRWALPRTDYPDGRAGYLRWRKALRRQHVAEVEMILVDLDYSPAEIEHVQELIAKSGRGPAREAQTHEDALCLVFLQTQLSALADRLGDVRTIEVLRRTMAKMSPEGLRRAIALPLSRRERSLVDRAST